jgi:hypothetical protein
MVSDIFDKIKIYINYDIFREKYFLETNSLITETLAELETTGIAVNEEKFKKHFDAKVYNGLVYSQYNLHTSTGRPSNRFGGVNYAALNKDDGSRESFISRFKDDGILALIDYSAFHPRIICELTNFKIPMDVEVYEYLAKLFFDKDVLEEGDVEEAKKLTFRQLYGGVEEKYSHISYFNNLKRFIDDYWNKFNKSGYVKTSIFERKITKAQIQDPNPNKLFNYILQATETEIAVPILNEVNNYLKDKKSKAILYTYDSILFDIHNEELGKILTEIMSIMKSGGRFPIKCYTGKSYGDLKRISL